MKKYNCTVGPFDEYLFRDLTKEEETHFRNHGMLQDPPMFKKSGIVTDVWWIMHPCVREILEERGFSPPLEK